MARYILLAFDSDAEADAFANAATIEGGIFYLKPDTHFANVDTKKVTVRGVWQKATKFCECGTAPGDSYIRGKTHGWWVHRKCMRPTAAWARGDHYFLSLGVNKLPVSRAAPEWRGTGVYGHNLDKERNVWVHAETGEDYDPIKARDALRASLGL
jgi:hypothetical protein